MSGYWAIGRVRIDYLLALATHVRVEVFDVQGRRVRTLVDEWRPVGRHTTMWNDRGSGSGLYFVRVRAGGRTATQRLIRMR